MASRSLVSLVSFVIVSVAAGCGGASLGTPSREAVRACETESACGLMTNFNACVANNSNWKLQLARTGSAVIGPDGIACLAGAGDDCDAAERCINGGQPAASCGDGSTSITSSCAGDELAACYQAMTFAFDCSSVGLHCLTSTTGYGSCGHGTCATDFVACVDGTTLASCNSGVETRQDCSVDGLGCVTDGTSGRCGGVGAECEPALPTCDGDVLVSCDGHTSRLDCTTQGLRCIVPASASGIAGCASADACDVTAAPTCDDATGELHYCYLGAPLVADCRGDGFSGCDATGCVR